jgi:hypothetical protein
LTTYPVYRTDFQRTVKVVRNEKSGIATRFFHFWQPFLLS